MVMHAIVRCKNMFFCDDDTESCSGQYYNCKLSTRGNALCQPGLCGPRYIPIDARGKQQKKIDFDKFVDPINCLASFGAADKTTHRTGA